VHYVQVQTQINANNVILVIFWTRQLAQLHVHQINLEIIAPKNVNFATIVA